MKNAIILLFVLAWLPPIYPEDSPTPKMPDEVTLTSGRVLKKVQVVRWEKDRVVLKYAGGADPIAFDLFKTPTPAEIEEIRVASIPKQKIAAEEEKRQKHFESLILQKKIDIGMTPQQAERAWGPPRSKNISKSDSGQSEIWFYQPSGTYIQFRGGLVTNWQIDR